MRQFLQLFKRPRKRDYIHRPGDQLVTIGFSPYEAEAILDAVQFRLRVIRDMQEWPTPIRDLQQIETDITEFLGTLNLLE